MPPRIIQHKNKFCYSLATFLLLNSYCCLAPAAFNMPIQHASHQALLDQAWKTIRIRAGDSLARRLQDNNLAVSDLNIMDTQSHTLLSKLKPGEVIEIIPEKGHISWLRYHPTKTTLLLMQRKQGKLTSSITSIPMTYNLNFKSVRVRKNLSSSEHAAQFSNTMIHDVEHMFAGSVDLNRSLHRNDRLDILYEEYYLKGVLNHTGHVVAATLHNRNKDITTYEYKLPNQPAGFYKANGFSVEPLFLSFPLKFTRVSSKFNMHRLDPVTHHFAPHVGVDFAAKSGTPIESIGNGQVTYIGWLNGYGKTIKINYGQHRQSLYGHLSGYTRGLHVGQAIRKGDVIGYVGQTGWATGPHLHFGFYLNNKPVDWLTYNKPLASPIPAKQRKQFLNYTQELKNQLDLYHDVQLAKNNFNINEDPQG